jgi:hypothetical protein
MRHPPSCGIALVERAKRSEPASGSLKPWHQIRSPAAIGGRWVAFWAAVPNSMMAGPTQLSPMYWAPRGSWWAHISSRTTVWSHSDPADPPNSSGHDKVSRPRAANSLQKRWVMARSSGSSLNAPRKPAGIRSRINSRSKDRSSSPSSPNS